MKLFLRITGIIYLLASAIIPVRAEGNFADSPEISLSVPAYDPEQVIDLFREKKTWLDRIIPARIKSVLYTGRWDLFHRYATEGFEAVKEPLHNYYYHIFDAMPPEERKEELRLVMDTISMLHSPRLQRETDFIKALSLPLDTPEEVDRKVGRMNELAGIYMDKGDIEMEMRCLRYLILTLYRNKRYSDTFLYAARMINRLETISQQDYPDSYDEWFSLGQFYLDFRDYERAIPYLKRSVREVTGMFFHRSNLQSRIALSQYYHQTGNLPESDHWYLSILESDDVVNGRQMYNCMAMEGLARNLYEKGRYAEALQLYQTAWPHVKRREQSYHLGAGFAEGMGECFLASGQAGQAGYMIDTAHIYLQNMPASMRLPVQRRLYPLQSRYYSAKGNNGLSMAYMDSTLQINRQYEDEYNALILLRAEQEQFRSEQLQKENELRQQEQKIRLAVIVSALLLFFLFVILLQYHKKQAAYRKLIERSREWAEKPLPVRANRSEANQVDLAIMEDIRIIMEQETLYRDPSLTLESLATRLNLHRNTVSKAINTTQKKNFATFINDYRIQEAIQLLSLPEDPPRTLDCIAFDCGFNDRRSFYHAFRKKVGVSPSLFRKNIRD